MTALNPPSSLSGGSYTAVLDRVHDSAYLQPGLTSGLSFLGGVRPTSDQSGLQVVAASTANNTVVIKAGIAFVPEQNGGGVYVCANDGDVVVTIPAASTTLNRRDLIVAKVRDSDFLTGATDSWALEVVPGTAVSGTPTAPALPGNAIALAEVLVNHGTTTVITQSLITDRRGAACVALGGTIPTTSTNMPTNPFPGMSVYCTDIDELRLRGINGWRRVTTTDLADTGAYTQITPSFTTSAGTVSLGNGSIYGRYRLTGKSCHYYGRLNWGSSGINISTGYYYIGLPPGVLPSSGHNNTALGTCWFRDVSPGSDYMGFALMSGTSFVVRGLNAPSSGLWACNYPVAPQVTDWLSWDFTYEVA
jgi:hypothetical protein